MNSLCNEEDLCNEVNIEKSREKLKDNELSSDSGFS